MHEFDAILHVDIINRFIYYIYISYIGMVMGAWCRSNDSVVCCFQLKMETHKTRRLLIGNAR
jgi:hypothetical protein